MRLSELINGLPIDLAGAGAHALETVVTDVVEDSREVGAGALFVARAGTAADGRRFVPEAVRRGAAAVLVGAGGGAPDDLDPGAAAVLVGDDPAGCGARLAERFHGHPSRRLALVGITGTNGKTTVAWLVRDLLVAAGRRCGMIGTVAVDVSGDGDDAADAGLTTPSACTTSRLLGRMVEAGCDACVMEASSHALDQGRTDALRFAGGVFTNLSGDHLDYHGTMEAYLDAKGRLFSTLPRGAWAVVNADDPAGAAIAARCHGEVVTTTTHGAEAAARATVGASTIAGTAVRLDGPWGTIDTHVSLVGGHNAANVLQATVVAHRLGLDAAALEPALVAASAPPGRLERVTAGEDPFAVFVDYAHTDDALDNVLAALRPVVPDGGALHVVFGCGGDRDRTKRPRMAAAACRWADRVTVTSDNPRTEDPETIIDDVMPGVPPARRGDTDRCADRAAAIRDAITRARPGDVVLIAGKGHEDYQIVGTERRAFDDRLVARAALADARAVSTG